MPRFPHPAIALALLAGFASTAAAQSTLRAEARSTVRGIFPSGPGTRQPQQIGGTYSLHTGAAVDGGGESRSHQPALALPPAPGMDIFPVRTVMAWDPNRGMNVPTAARPSPTPAWPTLPKNFAGISDATSSQQTGVAPNGLSTTASAWAQINMNNTPLRVDSGGTFARVVQQTAPVGRRGPAGSAGSLVLDPISFIAAPGDVLFSSLSLPSGQIAQADADGFAAVTIEVGANISGLSAGEIGVSHAGNPLLARLSLTFLPGQATPSVFFDVAQQGGMSYFSPSGSPLAALALMSQVSAMLQDPQTFQYNAAANSWSLPSDLSLFSYAKDFPQGMSSLQVDLSAAGLAYLPAPAPGAASAVILSAALLSARRRRSINR